MKNQFKWQITILPILFIILTASIFSLLQIIELNKDRKKQISDVSEQFITQHKQSAKERVLMASELIKFQNSQTEEMLNKRLKERVDEAIHIANKMYEENKDLVSRSRLKKQIKLYLSNAIFDHPDGYFFAVDMETETIIVHKFKELIGYSMSNHKDNRGTEILTEQKRLLSNNDGAYQTIYFRKYEKQPEEYQKITYTRYFKPFNWLIGTGEYLNDIEDRLQSNLLKRLTALYSGTDNPLCIQEIDNLDSGIIGTYGKLTYCNNNYHNSVNLSVEKNKCRGTNFTKENLKILDEEQKGFYTGFQKTKDGSTLLKKTTYLYYDSNWKWVISSGFHYDSLDDQLKMIEEQIDNKISEQIETSILITILIGFLISSIFYIISKTLTKTFNRYNKQIEEANKMESIGTLAGGIAHDFNNILFPIMGNSELLLMETEKDSHTYKRLKDILDAALRAKDLIQQILTFARKEGDDLKEIKIQPIISEALKLLRSTIPSTIEIDSNISSNCGTIMGNSTQIHQVVMNLSVNSFHAMEDQGGVLTIGLEEVDLTKDRSSKGLKGRYACLTISDTGTGIEEEVIKKIFDPFFTTKKVNKGTGMGLSVVHGIVKRMGGVINLESKVGKGTTFKINIPISDDKPIISDKSFIAEDPIGVEDIVVVDDEQPILDLVRSILENSGYRVSSFNNSIQALNSIENEDIKCDLIISDLTMPQLSGDKLAKKIKMIKPDLPIILYSGYHDKITPQLVKKLELAAVLSKPIKQKNLITTVREVLDRKLVE